jgi:hypothetical protein
MDQVKNLYQFIFHNETVKNVWAALIVLLLIYIAYSCFCMKKAGFKSDNVSAPLPQQRDPSVLGVGSNAKYASEFSQTNQGKSNIFTDIVNTYEGMTGTMEKPVFSEPNRGASDYQHGMAKGEKFTNKNMFVKDKEHFAHENQLKNILHGN